MPWSKCGGLKLNVTYAERFPNTACTDYIFIGHVARGQVQALDFRIFRDTKLPAFLFRGRRVLSGDGHLHILTWQTSWGWVKRMGPPHCHSAYPSLSHLHKLALIYKITSPERGIDSIFTITFTGFAATASFLHLGNISFIAQTILCRRHGHS